MFFFTLNKIYPPLLKIEFEKFYKNYKHALIEARRNIEDVELIAVSKKLIDPNQLYKLSKDLEKSLQEIEKKWTALKNEHVNIRDTSSDTLSKKISQIISNCDVIHTVDREKVVKIISEMDATKLLEKKFFIQINTANEVQKAGVKLELADAFIETCKSYKVAVHGLMCLPPANEHPSQHLEEIADVAKNHNLKYLSMGMTNDYDTALKYGATTSIVDFNISNGVNYLVISLFYYPSLIILL